MKMHEIDLHCILRHSPGGQGRQRDAEAASTPAAGKKCERCWNYDLGAGATIPNIQHSAVGVPRRSTHSACLPAGRQADGAQRRKMENRRYALWPHAQGILMKRKYWILLIVLLLVIALDQSTKLIIQQTLPLHTGGDHPGGFSSYLCAKYRWGLRNLWWREGTRGGRSLFVAASLVAVGNTRGSLLEGERA